MIYILSNVQYPRDQRLRPEPGDLLVFLNRAATAEYYSDHPRKMCIRRSPKPEYGSDLAGTDNRYLFSGPRDKTAPSAFINGIGAAYDWNFPVETGKTRSATTGYMAVKWLEQLYPGERLALVNFGLAVENSTYRCPWHNWRFENEALRDYQHIYL